MKIKKLDDEQLSRILSAADAGEIDYMDHRECYAFHAFGASYANSMSNPKLNARWWEVSSAVGRIILAMGDKDQKPLIRPKNSEVALEVLRQANLV